ncbi:MAG: hypothetical protein K6G52_04130 [Treponemataceae bacterium]|nr:hypothetical protein [Treponemataceae bacterium]
MIEDFASLSKEDPSGSDVKFIVNYYADGLTSSEIDYSNAIKASKFLANGSPSTYDPDQIPGFNYLSQSETVNSAGIPVLNLVYSRKSISITFDLSGEDRAYFKQGEQLRKTVSAKFGSPTESFIPDADDINLIDATYAFAGWTLTQGGELTSPQVSSTFPQENVTYYAKWIQLVRYEVKYYLEDVSVLPSVYVEDSELSYTAYGPSLGTIEYETPSKEYYLDPVISGDTIIKADGSSVLEIRYEKASVTVSFSTGTDERKGLWTNASSSNGSPANTDTKRSYRGKIGSPISDEMLSEIETSIDGWIFVGWTDGTSIMTTPSSFPQTSCDYVAVWSQNVALYSIEYYFEKWDLASSSHYLESGSLNEANFNRAQYSDSQTAVEPEAASAEIGSRISVSLPSFTGFTAIEPEEFEITENSAENVIKIYFYRNQINLTYKSDSDSAINGTEYGKFTDNTTSKIVSGYYGDTVSQTYTASDLVKATAFKTWEFESWSGSQPEKFPAENQTYIARWTQTQAPYTVKYLFEDVFAGQSTWSEDVTRRYTQKGDIGSTTNVQASSQLEVEGYYSPEVTNVVITEDTVAVVTVKYSQKPTDTESSMADPTANDVVLTLIADGNSILASCSHEGTEITSCAWYIDGKPLSNTGTSIRINNVSEGEHTILLVAEDGFATYTKTKSIVIE